MSTAVPNVVTVLMNVSSCVAMADAQGDRDVGRVGVDRGRATAGRVGGELLVQRRERRVAAAHGLAAETVRAGARATAGSSTIRGATPSGCRARRRTLTGGSSRCAATSPVSSPTRTVGGDHAPVAVDGERRVGLVAGQQPVERLADGVHHRLVERAAAVDRRVAGREQQLVALAQRDVELLGEAQHHLGARLGAAGLDEAQVARRDAGLEGEVELAEAPPAAPVAQQPAYGRRAAGGLAHGEHGNGRGALSAPPAAAR